ncbi:ATP-binding protein [Pseudochelatococcus sp. B33]
MSRGSDTTTQQLWSDPALAELVERETAAVLWSLDGSRVIGASVGTAGLAPALRAAGGESLRGRLRRVAAALSAGSGVRLERVTLPQGYGITRLLLECHRVATQDGEFLLTILRGPLPRLPRVVVEGPAGPGPAPGADAAGSVVSRDRGGAAGTPGRQPDIQQSSLERLRAFAGQRRTVRFVWESDAEGRLTRVSGELAALVGDAAGRVEDRPWQALVDEGIVSDPDGAVAAALAQHATWSGKEVLWRLGDDASALRLPVELAGIPVHDPRRRFRGYRGFGLARVSRLGDPAAAAGPGDAHAGDAHGPQRQEPGLPRDAEPRGEPHQDEPQRSGLSENEKQAFRDIARALGGAARPGADEAAAGEAEPTVPPADGEATAGRGVRRLRLVAGDADGKGRGRPSADGFVAESSGGEGLAPEGQAEDKQVEDDWAAAPPAWLPPYADSHERSLAKPDDPDQVQPAFTAPAEPGRAEASPSEASPVALGPDAPSAAGPAAAASANRGADATDSVALIANRLPIGMLVSRDGEVLFVNRALLDLLGYDDAPAFRRAGGLRSLFMSTPGGGEAPLALRTAYGAPLSVDARMATIPWRDTVPGRNRPATLMSFRRAIEPRTEAHLRALERELRHQEARVRALDTILDTATDGVVTLDGLGRLLSMNRSAEALFGCEETDVVGGSFWHLLSAQSRTVATAYFEGLRAGGLASVLNDGLAVRARAPAGSASGSGEIPLMMIMGRLAPDPGDETPGAGRGAARGAAGRAQRFFAILRDVSAAPGGVQAGAVGGLHINGRRESGDQAQFLARVSHEIRTPLNAIIGFAEIMLEERFGPIGTERYREYLRDIHASGGQVISLVNDLLDLARIEAGRLELAPADVSLNDVVSGCVGLMMPQAERQRVVLRTSLLPGLASVNIDERALQQIVLNLLSNAVKFTDAGGQVIVSTAQADDGGATLRIRDTGIGMTRSQVTAALTPFAQLNTTHLGRPDGAGLGLPLTRALVEASGGRFAITSAPMEGTLVEIAFPRAEQPAGLTAPRPYP